MQQIERKKLSQAHEKRIRIGVPKQELMKLFNATAENIAEGYVEVAIPHQESLVRGAGNFMAVYRTHWQIRQATFPILRYTMKKPIS